MNSVTTKTDLPAKRSGHVLVALRFMDIACYLRSPAHIACLILVILAGFYLGVNNVPPDASASEAYRSLSDQVLAGKTFRYAAVIAGLLACGWSAAAILEDRDSYRLEMCIACDYPAWRYVCFKAGGLLVVMLIPALVLVLLSWGFRGIVAETWAILPYLEACLIIYFPSVLFALLFGMCLGTITQIPVLPLLIFVALWIGGFLYLPPEMSAFDVTGETLNTAFFDTPAEMLPREDYPSVPQSIRDISIALYKQKQMQGVPNLVFLLSGFIGMAALLFAWLSRKWKIDATTLITASSFTMPSLHLPQALLWLKTMQIAKLIGVIVAIMFGSAALLLFNDQRLVGSFLIESFVPLCFTFLYAGVYANDARLEVDERSLASSRFYRPYLLRSLFITVVLFVILCILALMWRDAMSLDVFSVFVAGVAPAIFFGGMAFTVGVVTRSAAGASVFSVGLWAIFHFQKVAEVFSQSAFSLLYPFPASVGIVFNVSNSGRMPVLLIGIAFFCLGARLLSSPERLVLKE